MPFGNRSFLGNVGGVDPFPVNGSGRLPQPNFQTPLGGFVKDVGDILQQLAGGIPGPGGGGTPGGTINAPAAIFPQQLTPARFDTDPTTSDMNMPGDLQTMRFPELNVTAQVVGNKVLVTDGQGNVKCCPLNKPRRMNVLNPCAAKRSMRRLSGLQREMKKLDRMLKKIGKGSMGPARRRSC